MNNNYFSPIYGLVTILKKRIKQLTESSMISPANGHIRKMKGKLLGTIYIKRIDKWRAGTKRNGKTIHLGYYETEIEAHQAYLDYWKIHKKIDLVIPDGMKRCSSCGEIKPIDSFNNRKLSKDGKYLWCKECKYKNYIERYKEKDMPRRREHSKIYLRNKRKNDIKFKIKSSLRSRLKQLLKRNTKSSVHLEKLGCSVEELRQQLESKFYPNPITGENMTWDNYGKCQNHWQIDHIVELHSVDLYNPEQQKLVFHYTNLQPLWHEDHVKKTTRNRGKRNE